MPLFNPLLRAAWIAVLGGGIAGMAQAQQAESPLAWIPAEAPEPLAVMSLQPDRLKTMPGPGHLHQLLAREAQRLQLPLGPDDIRQMTVAVFFLPGPERSSMGEMVFATVAHLKKNVTAGQLIPHLGGDSPKQWKQGVYYAVADRAWALVNGGRTLLVAGGPKAEATLRRMLQAGSRGAAQASWASPMRSFRLGQGEQAPRLLQLPLALYLRTQAVHNRLPSHEETLRREGPVAASLLLLLRKPEGIFLGLHQGKAGPELTCVLACPPEEEQSAEQLANVLRGLIATGQLVLGGLEQSAGDPRQKLLARTLRGTLGKVQVKRQKTRVMVSLKLTKQEFGMLLGAAASAAQAARETARRAQSQNNLRQLALAMHMFHDRHRYLPPAVARRWNGRELKHPVSWRVLLLPYLGEDELYRQYRFDEPWDSPNNLNVLKQMPAVFRHPGDAPDSMHTSYFVLVGPGTVFDPQVEQLTFRQIPDGTAGTLLIVEAKRKVPWTKPEDISFDPAKPLPKLGGWHQLGFSAAMCDASVHWFPHDTPARKLRRLILRNDGKP